ncbi:MAG TPA: hypothetical protein VMD59_15170 [Acidimicrobiales bacterium]|nr:hypothetical protein [Acidimicrobiales bacterium]
MTAARQPAVEIAVEAQRCLGELRRPWRSVGFDEINWTYTPTGQGLLALLGALGEGPYLVRSHYMFCSGSGFGLPHWGAGNVYHEHPDGSFSADFQILDRVYDAVTGAGHHPIVELGFTPIELVPPDALSRFAFQPGSPTQYGAYEAGLWSFPPRDLGRWSELVRATVEHCLRRYGPARLAEWRFECWNEPDIGYWRGSTEEYCQLYEATATAVRAAFPAALVGGPATTGDLVRADGSEGSGPAFLDAFLDYCAANRTPLDFVSFHSKGSMFRPFRTYLPAGAAPPGGESPSTSKVLREVAHGLEAVARRHAELGELPCLVDECDPSVPAHFGRFDNPSFGFRNSEYYAVFQCNMMKKLLDLEQRSGVSIEGATAWAFYFEGERCFEGTRSLLTYGGLEKPVLNAYRMLARLGRWRLAASSSAATALTSLLAGAEAGDDGDEVDVLAARGEDGGHQVLVWRHADDQFVEDREGRRISVRVLGLPEGVWTVRQWRIDDAHSNAFRRWVELGSPDYPDPEQLDALRARASLERCSADLEVASEHGELALEVVLGLPAVALVELSPRPYEAKEPLLG